MTSPSTSVAHGFALICATGLLTLSSGAFAVAAPNISDTDAHTGSSEGLVVSPASSLFEIELHPGQSESRSATLTNHSQDTLQVTLSSIAQDVTGDRNAASALQLAATSDGTCVQAPSVGLLSGDRLDQGQIAPGESRNICITVTNTASPELPNGAAVADLAFDAITVPDGASESSGAEGLALTGDRSLTWLLGAALAAVVAGVALLRRRQLKGEQHV